VNRSGILNGGVIGGRDQTGPWKIGARFNQEELIYRIESIAKMRNRIELSCLDALAFLKSTKARWPAKTLIYLDPPYYKKGRDLYYDFYGYNNHEEVQRFISVNLSDKFWIVSYDDAEPIRGLYTGYRWRAYKIGYSARESREGSEIMFFSDALQISPLVGPVTVIGGSHMGEQNDQYNPEEAERRSDELLKHMLNRPPQPHATRPPAASRSRKPAGSDQARRARGKAPAARDDT
jgi:DNA adenine methylase